MTTQESKRRAQLDRRHQVRYFWVSKVYQLNANGTVTASIGRTYDIGRNKTKREDRLRREQNMLR